MLVLEGLVGLHRIIQLQLLQHYWLGHRYYCDVEWLALEMKRGHSVIFETASKYCISALLLTMMATPFLQWLVHFCNVEDLGSIPGLGRSPGEGNGYPLQYSGLKNPMDCIIREVKRHD